MYTYSDFTVLIALNYTNKVQEIVAEIAESELGSEVIHGIALRPNSAFSMILQEKKGWLLS